MDRYDQVRKRVDLDQDEAKFFLGSQGCIHTLAGSLLRGRLPGFPSCLGHLNRLHRLL